MWDNFPCRKNGDGIHWNLEDGQRGNVGGAGDVFLSGKVQGNKDDGVPQQGAQSYENIFGVGLHGKPLDGGHPKNENPCQIQKDGDYACKGKLNPKPIADTKRVA